MKRSLLHPAGCLEIFSRARAKLPLHGLALALVGLFLLSALDARAANILVNPSFETNSGHALPVGWSRFAPTNAQSFGNYWIEGNVPAQSGQQYWKEWGASYVQGLTNVA